MFTSFVSSNLASSFLLLLSFLSLFSFQLHFSTSQYTKPRGLSVSHPTTPRLYQTNLLHNLIDISLGHLTVCTITLLDQHCTCFAYFLLLTEQASIVLSFVSRTLSACNYTVICKHCGLCFAGHAPQMKALIQSFLIFHLVCKLSSHFCLLLHARAFASHKKIKEPLSQEGRQSTAGVVIICKGNQSSTSFLTVPAALSL